MFINFNIQSSFQLSENRPIFSIMENTLGQCEPTHLMMSYHFIITHSINLKKFLDFL